MYVALEKSILYRSKKNKLWMFMNVFNDQEEIKKRSRKKM